MMVRPGHSDPEDLCLRHQAFLEIPGRDPAGQIPDLGQHFFDNLVADLLLFGDLLDSSRKVSARNRGCRYLLALSAPLPTASRAAAAT